MDRRSWLSADRIARKRKDEAFRDRLLAVMERRGREIFERLAR